LLVSRFRYSKENQISEGGAVFFDSNMRSSTGFTVRGGSFTPSGWTPDSPNVDTQAGLFYGLDYGSILSEVWVRGTVHIDSTWAANTSGYEEPLIEVLSGDPSTGTVLELVPSGNVLDGVLLELDNVGPSISFKNYRQNLEGGIDFIAAYGGGEATSRYDTDLAIEIHLQIHTDGTVLAEYRVDDDMNKREVWNLRLDRRRGIDRLRSRPERGIPGSRHLDEPVHRRYRDLLDGRRDTARAVPSVHHELLPRRGAGRDAGQHPGR
jgi:hypothetical protein